MKDEKLRAKSETIKEEEWHESAKDVFARDREDTPSGAGDIMNGKDARFTFSRATDLADSEEGECSDRGESGGEGGSIPCVIREMLALRPMKRLDRGASPGRPTVDKGDDSSKPNNRRKRLEGRRRRRALKNERKFPRI